MPFKLNESVDRLEFERHHNTEDQYIEELRERGLILDIDNVTVDAEQLVLRTFQCNTDYCVKCKGTGSAKEFKGSCCTDLQVDMTRPEVDKIVEMGKLARAKLNLPKSHPLSEIVDRILGHRITEISDENELHLIHRRNERCVMSWMEGDTLRCSINTLCDRLGLDLIEFKPDPCFLFPLHYTEYRKGAYLVSLLTKETESWIEQHSIVGRLRCLSKPEPGAPPAYVSLRYELEYIFGKKFYRELARQAKPILAEFADAASRNGSG